MDRHSWSRLTPLQVGRYAEYFAKMEFTLYGFDVYSTEVDDKGIDFVIRRSEERYYDVQVKSSRNANYIFFAKSKFALRENLLAAIVLFLDGQSPDLFLVPSSVWLQPNALFTSRDYEGGSSKPEWGLNMTKRSMPLLEPYRFEQTVQHL